jgi:hypothetical protein
MSKAPSTKPSCTRVRKQAVSPLLSLLAWAERQNLDLPTDLSEKHDEYLWGKSEKEK